MGTRAAGRAAASARPPSEGEPKPPGRRPLVPPPLRGQQGARARPWTRTGYRPFCRATDVSCFLPLGQRDGKCGDPGAGALRLASSEPPASGAGPARQRPSRGRQFVRLRPPSRPRCGAFRVPATAVRTLVTEFRGRWRCRHHGVALQPRTLSAAG